MLKIGDIVKLKENTKNKLFLENRLYNYLKSYAIVNKIEFGWVKVEFNINDMDEILLFRNNKIKRRFKIDSIYTPCINFLAKKKIYM